MKNQETLFFVGIDWSRNFHQVCVIDQQGSIIGEASFEHSGRGLFEMAQWIIEISDSEVCNISVAIEVNHGPVVESLIEQNFCVCSINPKQLDRFRDRFSPSGAKDDRKDALVLASALRTDSHHFHLIEPQGTEVMFIRELNRKRAELVEQRTRLINQFREQIWRYYPQFAGLLDDRVRLWHLELWKLAPCPDSVKGKRTSTVQNLLKRHKVRRIDAEEVLRILRAEKINVSVASRDACVNRLESIVELLELLERQIKETEASINKEIETLDSKLKTDSEGPTDIEILQSVPGVGPVVLATIIGEAWEFLLRRDFEALRCFGGTAPITRQSGRTKQVIRRKAVCRSLCDAFHVLGGTAARRDPVSMAKYKALRAKGHGHFRSARTVCDRILSVVRVLMKKRELFDKEFKKPWHDAAA